MSNESPRNHTSVCPYCHKEVRVIDRRYESHGSFPFFCRGTARTVEETKT